jgi:cyclophilin family peptidyl-prolyl cis-trans isomerase
MSSKFGNKYFWWSIGFAICAAIFILFQIQRSSGELTPQVSFQGFSKDVSRAVLVTTAGDIEILFFAQEAPKSVDNFINLGREGFFNETKFHRVIPDFMIQGGDPLTKSDDNRALWGTGGPGYVFVDEFSDIKLVRGVVAWANRGPNTNGSQFFIITAPATPWLEGKHTPFAKVVSGMDVVDKISRLPRDKNDKPLEPVAIKKIIFK